MPALLFGSISTVADTSELQRKAFNQAFKDNGLDWHWGRTAYQAMLEKAGGQDRIAAYAAAHHQHVDAAAVHRSKSAIFQRLLSEAPLEPRAGVLSTIGFARARGFKTGFVTTTSPQNVAALLGALDRSSSPIEFDVVIDSSYVERPKPDPAAYQAALSALHELPADCIALEDNADGVASAEAAGVSCVAFPNENTVGHDFGPTPVVDRADLDELTLAARG